MVQTTSWEEKLLSLYQVFYDNKNIEGQKSIVSLLKKVQDNSLYIAFCGHYSSGKSTLINYLFGDSLLPTSPIPTSGNIVQISSGSNQTTIYKQDGTVERFNRLLEDDQLKLLCKNGDEISKIELRIMNLFLNKGITLIDTAGIDSTDMNHALSTEYILPVIDVLFYVVDYNYVESEENILFVKRMKNRGKKVMIIVNQIDKHDYLEVPFEEYRKKILDIWNNIGVRKDDIYFISLKYQEYIGNELYLVQRKLEELSTRRILLIQENIESEIVFASLNQKEEYLDSDVKELQVELECLYNKRKVYENDYKSQINNTIQSAQLITYEMREEIRRFLESRQPTFRVSLLNKRKTVIEKEKRMKDLYFLLLQQMNIQLDIHVKKIVDSFVNNRKVYEMKVICREEILSDIFYEGAILTDSYVVQYSKVLEMEIKKRYKKYYVGYYNEIEEIVMGVLSTYMNELQNKIEIMEESRKNQDYYQEKIKRILSGELLDTQFTVEELIQIPCVVMNDKIWKKEEEPIQEKQEIPVYIDSAEILSKSKQIEKLLQSTPELAHLRKIVRDKQKNIENKTFSIVLFGAFSAGKSSFINGLVGSKILPSSPNPTTATVTYITAPTIENIHMTAKIIDSDGERIVSIHALEDYIADETVAKSIEKVEIYYDCEWTRKGITFIDTPGVNSIHKRHTEVSFSYMKEADMILYVTYYQHVFSKNDKEFLYQLGRVRDSVEMDNTFFILNAVDIAENETEIVSVEQYLKEQLRSSKIKNPRIFSVSSKLMYEENKYNQYLTDNMKKYISGDLTKQSVEVLWSTLYSIHNQIGILIKQLQMSEYSKEVEKNKLQEKLNVDILNIKEYSLAFLYEELRLEVIELLYYVKRRLLLRGREIFNECFHPSVIAEKRDIEIALDEFIKRIENNVVQEMLVSSLRIEQYILGVLQKEVETIQPEILLEIDIKLQTPKIKELLIEKNSLSPLISFKSTKTFFEGNEKKEILEKCLKVYEQLIDTYMKEINIVLYDGYQLQIINKWELVRRRLIREVEMKYSGTIQLLLVEDTLPLRKIYQEMDNILNS